MKSFWNALLLFIQEWRQALIGVLLLVIVIAITLLISGCQPATPYDPNALAIQNQQRADYYASMATATAQSQIVPITQTAAAFQINQQYAAATSTSAVQTQMAVLTVTAQSWTPTPNATTTAVYVQSIAEATKMANEVEINNLQVEGARITNVAKAVLWPLFGFVILFLGVIAALPLIKRLSLVHHKVDEGTGRIIPVMNVLEGTVIDIERSANGMVSMSQKFLAHLPTITPERQEKVTARAQMVDMASRAKLPRRLLEEQTRMDNNLLPAPENPVLIDYPLPEWNEWMQNWKPGHIALGINEKGLLQADPEIYPHLLFAGTTGSYKTRGGMRVAVACALASGWQVIIAGKALDYKVFQNQPNAFMVPFSLIKDPTKAIDLLRGFYKETDRRDLMMSRSNHSLWSQTGQTHTLLVIDEFSNLADALDDIDSEHRDELWRWARMSASEGRKYGMHLALALQDPTAKSISVGIRRNTTPVMFRVKDMAASRVLLNVNGAESLSVRHFLASLNKLERGAAFAPTDEEIMQFLNSHPVRTDEQPKWIEGMLVDQPTLPTIDSPQTPEPKSTSLNEFLQSLTDQDAKIIDLHIEGKSNRQIELTVFGKTGGQFYTKVSQLVSRYKELSEQSATTTSMPKMPNLGAVAA